MAKELTKVALSGAELATILTALAEHQRKQISDRAYLESTAWHGYFTYFRPLKERKLAGLINRLYKELRLDENE